MSDTESEFPKEVREKLGIIEEDDPRHRRRVMEIESQEAQQKKYQRERQFYLRERRFRKTGALWYFFGGLFILLGILGTLSGNFLAILLVPGLLLICMGGIIEAIRWF